MTDCTALVIHGPTGPTGPSGSFGGVGPTGSQGPTGASASGQLVYGGSVSIASGGNATVSWSAFPSALDSFVVGDGGGALPAFDTLTASSAKLYNTFGTTQLFYWVAVGH